MKYFEIWDGVGPNAMITYLAEDWYVASSSWEELCAAGEKREIIFFPCITSTHAQSRLVLHSRKVARNQQKSIVM